MSFKIVPDRNNQRIFIKLYRMDELMDHAIHRAFFEIGKKHVDHARDSMQGRKTGRIYKIAGITHQSSAAGESPAIISGALSRHVDYSVTGSSQLEFGDKSQTGKAPYGKYLELGFKMRKKMIAPRPHISTAVESNLKNTTVILAKHINDIHEK